MSATSDPFEKASRRSAVRRDSSRRRRETRRTVVAVVFVAAILVAGLVLIFHGLEAGVSGDVVSPTASR